MKLHVKLHVLGSLLLASSSLLAAQSTAPWSYEGKNGPIVWSKLDPSFAACNKGHEQSPIDIRGAHLNKDLAPIEYHYISGGVTVVNTGHDIQVNVHPGSYILVSGVRYDLLRFHFHTPAEEAVRGKFSDMDVHLVHKSADGKMLIVAVRFLRDRDIPNAQLATLSDHLPRAAGKEEKVEEMINPAGFLPGDRGYWTYMGSQTAPPCAEGVRWFVYQEEVPMSRAQYKLFNSLYKINSRPLQEAHGRRIEANE